ncbi:MAG: hypothetical protein ABSE22_03710 [Xanthobacteraceae bacterium]|jgi:hypothetical protein
MRILTLAVVVSALLTQASYAQLSSIGDAPIPLTEDEKADLARQKRDEKANDEAYKSTMKRFPDSNQKVDPWGGVRPSVPAAAGNK